MNVKNFINDVLMEAAIDSRVESGIVDFYDSVHMLVLEEKLRDRGLTESQVDSIFKEMVIKDGKYPDRQAYNKEGWLVTFPSKDYRDAAIKKGTHYISDPTHGKGGMNLYYKKRGKQKRQSQQDRTISEPGEGGQDGAPKAPDTTDASGTAPTGDNEPAPSAPANSNANAPTPTSGKSGGEAAPEDTGELPPAPSGGGGGGGAASGGSGGPSQAPVSTTPSAPVAPQPPPYAELSIKFAQSKGWTPTPYGEWRNPTGETTAVVGLTGEVVPIKHVEREEFKLFAQKNTV